jgi:hypothetical protein
MATVVFTGIPYFGPNLFEEPQQRLDMLKAWLQFYQEHKNDLTQGAFEPYGDLTELPGRPAACRKSEMERPTVPT